MDDEMHFRALENMYASAPCNRYYSPKLAVSKGAAEVIISVREKFFHSAGATHGSVYFKALDDAAFFACNSLIKDFLVLTVSFNIYLTRPVSGGFIRGIGEVVNRSRNFMVAESKLFDSKGKEIARGSGGFTKSNIRFSSGVGYR